MDKSKSLKKALISVLIFGVVALLAWGALFVVLGLGTQTKDGIPFFKLHFSQLIAVLGFPNNKYYLPLAFTVLGLLALAAIFLILMIVFSAVKRRGIMVLPFIVYLVATFGMWELFANFGRYTIADTTTKSGYTAFIESASLSKTIMTIALIACLFIAFVLAFIAFILSFVHACKYPGGKARVSKNELEEVNVEGEPGKFEEEPEPEQEPAKDEKAELIEMIKELIRQEVRGGQQSNQTVTGATFAAPLIVQYFNGTNPTGPQQNVQPAPAEEKKEEPQPEPEKKPEPKLELVVEPEPYEEPTPVKPEPVKEPEPQPEPEPEPQPEPEPAPVVEEPVQPVVVAPAPEPEPEKKPIIRIPFEERMVSADKEMKDNYNEIKNEILSYGVKSRVSNSGDTFRLHRKTYIKLTIAGKSLKLYFALNPDDYKDTTIPVQDASEKGIYEEIPLVFKVKSGLSMKRCKQLIADVMEKDNLTQGEIGKVNWAKEIAASLKEGKKAEKEEKDD